jgi:hypothetical protein
MRTFECLKTSTVTVASFPLAFLANMNVGATAHWIGPGGPAPPHWEDMRRWRIRRPAEPLPYVYTQDRLVPLTDDAQCERLLLSDLRRAACVEPDLPLRRPEIFARPSVPAGADAFGALQEQNRILRVDRHLNRATIEAEMRAPAMLVIAECWHPGWRARVDGRPAPVERVNYLQQGVWLAPGSHTVELSFLPKSMVYGTGVAAVSWLAFFGVVLGCGRKRRAPA